MKTNMAVMLTLCFLYLLGIGGAKAYYHSDNVDPTEVCAEQSREEYFKPAGQTYYIRSSPYEECMKENSSDRASETLAAIIWPLSLPVVIGERELGLW